MTAKTTTPQQHMMLEAHWPNDCCLCRLEAENASLRKRLEAERVQRHMEAAQFLSQIAAWRGSCEAAEHRLEAAVEEADRRTREVELSLGVQIALRKRLGEWEAALLALWFEHYKDVYPEGRIDHGDCAACRLLADLAADEGKPNLFGWYDGKFHASDGSVMYPKEKHVSQGEAAWLATDDLRTGDGLRFVRVTPDDEVVAHFSHFHMERMNDDHIWFQVDGVAFDLHAVRRGLFGTRLLWVPQCGEWKSLIWKKKVVVQFECPGKTKFDPARFSMFDPEIFSAPVEVAFPEADVSRRLEVKMSEKEWVSHIVQEGSRKHVVWWDSSGMRCSEHRCEVNRRSEEKKL